MSRKYSSKIISINKKIIFQVFFFFKKLILSETSIFDVLHSFYFHSNIQVRQAALEVRI